MSGKTHSDEIILCMLKTKAKVNKKVNQYIISSFQLIEVTKIMVNRQKGRQLTGCVFLGFGVVVDPTSSPRSFRPEGLWPSTCLEQSIGGDTVAVVLVVLVVTNRLRLESDEKASESTSLGVVVVVFLGETVHAKSGECNLKTRYLLFSASTVSQFFCCVQFVKNDGVP